MSITINCKPSTNNTSMMYEMNYNNSVYIAVYKIMVIIIIAIIIPSYSCIVEHENGPTETD